MNAGVMVEVVAVVVPMCLCCWTWGWLAGYESASKFAKDVVERQCNEISRRKTDRKVT